MGRPLKKIPMYGDSSRYDYRGAPAPPRRHNPANAYFHPPEDLWWETVWEHLGEANGSPLGPALKASLKAVIDSAVDRIFRSGVAYGWGTHHKYIEELAEALYKSPDDLPVPEAARISPPPPQEAVQSFRDRQGFTAHRWVSEPPG